MKTFSKFLLDNWEFLLAVIGAVIGLWRFLIVRRAELAWKRTEFLFLQAYYLDTNKDLSEIVQIIERRHPEITIEKLLNENDELDELKRKDYLHKLDKLLNLFDRIQYAVFKLKTLSLKEIESISWYLYKICENEDLKSYCNEFGFNGVLKLAKKCKLDT